MPLTQGSLVGYKFAMRRVRIKFLVKSVAYALALVAIQSYALSGGIAVNPTQYAGVVMIRFNKDDPKSTWVCTGTKVGAQQYLTAAHCVSETGSGDLRPVKTMNISHGTEYVDAFNQNVTITHIHIHPEWKNQIYLLPLRRPEQKLLTGTDQAIIEIKEQNDLPIIPIDFDPISEGEVIHAAGYGIQSVGPGFKLPPGQFRVTKKVVNRSLLQPRVIQVGPHDAKAKDAQQTYSQFAPGDSGGPILRVRDFPLKAPKISVVGIMSFILDEIYINPKDGTPVVIPEDSNPRSFFVRLQSIGFMEMNLWLMTQVGQYN